MTAPAKSSQKYRLIGIASILAAAIVSLAIWFRPPPARAVPEIPLDSLSADAAGLLQKLQKEVRDHPDSAQAWGRLGMGLFAHQIEAANECFARAGQLDRQEFLWPYLQGLYLSTISPDRARELFQEALKRDPKISVVHTRLAELLFDRGETESAKLHFQKAAELDKQNARAWLGLARVAHAQNAWSTSLTNAQRAVDLSPREKTPRAFLARILYQLDQQTQAEEHHQLAQQLPDDAFSWQDPYAAEILQMRRDSAWRLDQASELVAAGRAQEALILLAQLAAEETRDPGPAATLGRLLTEQRRYPEAEQVLHHAKQQFPESAEVEFRLGTLYFLTGRLPAATEAFRSAIRINPTHFPAYFNLGQSLWKLSQRDEALAALEAAAELRPESVDAQWALGKLLFELEQYEQAREHLKIVLTFNPNREEARKLLEQIP